MKCAKEWINPEDNSAKVYMELCQKALKKGKEFFFGFRNNNLLIKEKPSSETVKYKYHFSKITSIAVIPEYSSICFIYDGKAWAMHLPNDGKLKMWANAMIYFREEGLKETEDIKFPKFPVVASFTSKHLVFLKEEPDYSFERPKYNKMIMSEVFKAFDTMAMEVKDEDLVLKKQRSVDVLSDSED